MGAFLTFLIRSLKSKNTLAAVAGIFIAFILNNMSDIALFSGFDKYYFFSHATAYNFMFLIYFFAAFPFAGSFIDDLNNHFCYFELLRIRREKYWVYKSLAVFCSACMVTFVSCLLFFIFLSILLYNVPFRALDYSGYEILLKQKHTCAYIIVKSSILSFASGSIATISFALSVFLKNASSVMGLPLVLFFGWITICQMFNLPGVIAINKLIAYPVFDSFIGSFLYSVIFMTGISMIIMNLLKQRMMRRIENE